VHWQVAALAEFRKDWQTALRSYDAAYRQLQSVPGGGQFPVQRYFETLACAELLHFKVRCGPQLQTDLKLMQSGVLSR